MSTLDSDSVAARLGFDEQLSTWARGLGMIEPVPGDLELPSCPAAAAVLGRLGVAGEDAVEPLASLPSARADPEIWWLLGRCRGRVLTGLGQMAPPEWWPQLPAHLGAAGRSFYVHLYLAMLPETLAWHRRHGVPETVSWATLADLGRHMAIHRRIYGSTGVDAPWWMMLHLRGELLECGRLQYDRHLIGLPHEIAWYGEAGALALGTGFRIGDPALGIHIPEAGPLSPDACDASLHQARSLFGRCFPEANRRIATCTSWLLDDQLQHYLDPDTNILRFQRRFELVEGSFDDDEGILGFVFRRSGSGLDRLPQTTALERGVVAHLRAGGHWRVRTGWLLL
ncbi:MAG TPA: acyltransferase domain-containing protein [Acidimicrobiales bacterium]|nr:acyltransferase domain-containing protein [Acidimicrobiales bacterium]